MGVIVAPILLGKLEAWKQFVADLSGPRKKDLEDFNRRNGLTRHAAWLATTPDGAMVVAYLEGSGADEVMPKLGPSQNAFDLWFKSKLLEVHGLDASKPPPGPLPELYFDSGA